jgi:hypothetical protein
MKRKGRENKKKYKNLIDTSKFAKLLNIFLSYGILFFFYARVQKILEEIVTTKMSSTQLSNDHKDFHYCTIVSFLLGILNISILDLE